MSKTLRFVFVTFVDQVLSTYLCVRSYWTRTDDLDELELALQTNALPETFGFFFGETRPEEIDEDFAFITKARESLRDGYFVYYFSWW